jgi:hypothetical protein
VVALIIRFATASAAEKQIDQLQNLTNAMVIASIVLILADAAAERDVTFLGFKAETSGAYVIAAWAFVLVTLMASQLFARLGDIVMLAEEEEVPEVLATLFNHRWVLNPFSYFGSHPIAILHTSLGTALFGFQWWLGFTALAELWDRMSRTAGTLEFGLWGAYIVAGLLGLIALLRVQWAVDLRLAVLARTSADCKLLETRRAIQRVFFFKFGMSVVFAALGYWVYYAFTHIGM